MNEVASSNVNTGAVDGSGRVRVVTEPALPAICAMCKKSANGAIRFIDFQFDMDYYGAVVFCEDCMKECMIALDFVPASFFEEERDLTNRLEAALEVANNELDKYRSIVTSLRDVGVISEPDVVDAENSDESVGQSEQADGTSVETESDSDGSDPVGGLKNISIFAD